MRPRRRTTFVTTAICLIGAAVSIALMVTGRANSSTAVLLVGAAIGFLGGVYSLWATRARLAARADHPPHQLRAGLLEQDRPVNGPRRWWRYAKARSEDRRAARKARRQQARAAAPVPLPGILRGPRQAALIALAVLIAAASLTAFTESYRGLFDWAREHGLSGFWAAAWPLQVDVFVAVGELTLFVALVDAWRRRSRVAAWAVTLAGLGVSVAGNVGHVHSTHLASRVTAAVPPLAAAVALAVGLGVLKRIVEHRQAAARGPLRNVAADVQTAAIEALRATTAAGNPLSGRQLEQRFGLSRPDVTRVRDLVARETTQAAGSGRLNLQGGVRVSGPSLNGQGGDPS